MKTLVIAEPGCTHEGSFDALVKLLHTAADCGADVFKPQWVSDPVQMCERRHIGVDHPKRDYYLRAYSWLNFPIEWHGDLKRTCVERGMQYACTVFLPQDVWIVAPYSDVLKIASFEAAARGLVWTARATGKRVLISSGMVDITRGSTWLDHGATDVLHCVSAYPAPLDAMNLSAIGTLRLEGLSDHSRHLLTGALAVACGAEVIETHFRLDDCDPDNPDYAVAFTPAEFRQYIQNIRDAELMLGDGEKKIQPCEAWALPYRVVS